MKYNDNGTFKEIHIKALDTLPVGAEVDYDGEIIPNGWTEVESLDDKLVNVGSEIDNDYDINILKGKNLFGGHFESIQKNGITTSYSNGILTIDGTATATTDIRFTGASLNLKPNTPYTITAFYIDGTINGTAIFYWQNGTVWRGFSLTLANSTTSQTRDNTYTNVNLELNTNTFIRVNSGASFNNYQIKIQIEQNETSTSYEAYITPSLKVKGETIFTKNNYEPFSRAETKIGTWIDGKPLYRKVFTGYATTKYVIVDANFTPSLYNTVHIYGTRKATYGQWWEINSFYPPSSADYSSSCSVQDEGISLVGGNNMYSSNATACPYIIIVEYTKTTD